MVGDLLDQQRSELLNRDGIQVTGKVALSHSSSSSSSSSTTSTGGSAQAAVATSVIRRSPDSPDSGNEDSTWFLRQVLHQQQQERSEAADQVDEGAPLTPATSPARGIRRPRHNSSASVEEQPLHQAVVDEDEEELLKKESAAEEEDDEEEEEEEKKRSRVESIVSTMRTSTPAAINGCKKRKLYQPQQHGHTAISVGKFTSEGEEEDDETDERNDSLSEEQHELNMARAQASSRSSSAQQRDMIQMQQQQQQHDPIRSLQERIASLHQQRFAALQRAEKPADQPAQQQQQIRRPVRDDAGRTRNPLHQPNFNMRSAGGDLSHVSQAHAAYLDATRRLLMEQQQQRQQQQPKPVQQQQPVAQAAQQPQQKEPMATELEGLAEMLKSELASSLAQLVDSTLSRFAAQQQQQRRNVIVNNSSSKSSADESELSKLQRGRVIDRGLRNGDLAALGLTSPFLRTPYGPLPHHLFPQQQSPNAALNHIVNSIGAGIHPAAAAAAAAAAGLANIGSFVQQQQSSQAEEDAMDADAAEQNEALSLVVSPKKRRFNNNNNKTTTPSERNGDESPLPNSAETRLSPLEISLINQSSSAHSPPPSRTPSPPSQQQQQRYVPAQQQPQQSQPSSGPPPLLHHPSLFSNYSAYFAAAAAAAAAGAQAASSSQRSKSPVELDMTSPSTSSLLHPALLASHHHHHRSHHHSSSHHDNTDRHSESSDGASPYGSVHQSSTLTPMHLRKAKLMFFWCRYPSSSVLKTFFPDVNFNKNNTAQLVKWFSNFRLVLISSFLYLYFLCFRRIRNIRPLFFFFARPTEDSWADVGSMRVCPIRIGPLSNWSRIRVGRRVEAGGRRSDVDSLEI